MRWFFAGARHAGGSQEVQPRDSRGTCAAGQSGEAGLFGLVDFAPVAAVVWRGRVIVRANAAFAEMFGRGSSEEVVGRPISEFFLQGRATQQGEIRTIGTKADGTRFAMSLRRSRIEADGGAAHLACCHDLTESHRAEESLRRTQFSVDHAPDLVYWVDKDARLIDASAVTCERLGYNKEELLDMTLFDVTVGLERGAWPGIWGSAKAGSYEVERRLRTKLGATFPVAIKVSHMELEGREYHCVFARDIQDRLAAEARIRHLSSFPESNAFPVLEFGENGEVFYANPAALSEVAELGLTGPREFLPLDQAQLREIMTQAHNQHFCREVELGNKIFEETISYLADFETVRVSAADATDRKRVEEQLRLTQLSVDKAADLIHWLDQDGRILYASDEACRRHGYSREELLGMTIFDIDPTETLDHWEKSWEQWKQNGSATFESMHRTRSGELFPVEVVINYVMHNGKEYNFAFARDITERKAAERSLRLMGFSVDHAGDMVAWMDQEGRFVYVNDTLCRRMGFAREEILGMSVRDIDTEAARSWDDDWGILKARGTSTIERFNKTKSGERFPVEINANYVCYEGQEYNFSFVRDVSDRKHQDAALHQAQRNTEATNKELQMAIARANELTLEAQTASAAKSEFLANMSHEIRTPMNGVIGMTNLLLGTELTAEQRDYAETVRKSAESLLTIVNDVLDFSKIEAGKLEVENLDFDLRTALEDMGDLLAVRAQEKGLEFTMMVEPEVPSLLNGDPGRMRQVITNLVGNAIKFTEWGEIAVRVSLEEDRSESALLRFEVRDTGIGVAEDKLELLFEPFTQADASMTRRFGGTGLGLSISKRLTELMHGRIGAVSAVGKGSTFWFTAQLGKQTAAIGETVHAGEDPLPETIEGVRVLTVDDNQTNRRVVAGMLDPWGTRHVELDNGREALAVLRKAARSGDPYLLAILDMQMPGIDGEALGSMIRQDPSLNRTALVMMTSVGSRGDAARLQRLGFSAYLTKPVKQSQLHDCLVTVLNRGSVETGVVSDGIVTRHSLADQAKRRTRILLAEDNLVNQKVAVAVLQKLGYRADVVGTGVEALAALRKRPYDLVLMDIQMPDMDGLEATARIRDEREGALNRGVPIVALTAHAMTGDKERCLAAGMDDYLRKPLEAEELQIVVERWTLQGCRADAPVAREHQHVGRADLKTESADTPPSRPFDPDVLRDMLGNDTELAREIIAEFLVDARQQIDSLHKAVSLDSPERVRRQAHTLKGASAAVGALALQQQAVSLEEEARSAEQGELERLGEHLRGIDEAFAGFVKAVERESGAGARA
jgi:two-component system, sensor histidine kinase and response regulator